MILLMQQWHYKIHNQSNSITDESKLNGVFSIKDDNSGQFAERLLLKGITHKAKIKNMFLSHLPTDPKFIDRP